MKVLPFISIDEEVELNLVIVMIVLWRHSISAKGKYLVDFDKLQCFVYLMKNPARIEQVLKLVGKKTTKFESRYTHTIESMSSNVDMLFDRSKLKSLLSRLASLGFLGCYSSG